MQYLDLVLLPTEVAVSVSNRGRNLLLAGNKSQVNPHWLGSEHVSAAGGESDGDGDLAETSARLWRRKS